MHSALGQMMSADQAWPHHVVQCSSIQNGDAQLIVVFAWPCRCEDDRYEFDLCIETNASAMRVRRLLDGIHEASLRVVWFRIICH